MELKKNFTPSWNHSNQLTYFWPLFRFYTLLKRQKTQGVFGVFRGLSNGNIMARNRLQSYEDENLPNRLIKTKEPWAHFVIKNIFDRKCKTPLHSFSIKNIFYDKMDFRLFYFDKAKHSPWKIIHARFWLWPADILTVPLK